MPYRPTNPFSSGGPAFLTAFGMFSESMLTIDLPVAGSVAPSFPIGGWAIDRGAGADAGIDAIHVYAYPNPGSGAPPIFLGVAGLGFARSDIGAIFGSQFANAGWTLDVGPLASGQYLLAVFARSALTGTFDAVASRSVTVTAPVSQPLVTIDAPGPGTVVPAGTSIFVGGWAIDRGAVSGTGIDAIHIWIFPAVGSPFFGAVANYGITRPDIGAIFGAQFTASGYDAALSGLTPGSYTIVVAAHSPLTNSFSIVQRAIQVQERTRGRALPGSGLQTKSRRWKGWRTDASVSGLKRPIDVEHPLNKGQRRVLSVKVIAALTVVVVCLSASARAQETGRTRTPAFRSAAALVALTVTVQDRGAKFVRDLQPGDFVVYEDGVKQDVQFFESTRVPVDLIVLIDTSLSMRDKLPLVHEAASGFLKTLRPDDRGAVVSFSNNVSVLQALTSDQALLEAAVRSTKPRGETCLNNAVYIALKSFGQATRQDGEIRRQAIVLLSDGADTASLVSFEDVIALARQMGVTIYTVSLESQAEKNRLEMMGRRRFESADYAMKALAKETGAQWFLPAPTALKDVYASIATEIASQYSIGYIPANGRSDGTFRRVNVQVVTRPDLRSRTRLGYTAGSSVTSAAAQGAGGLHER